MAELKTRPSRASVQDFLGELADLQQRRDCRRLAQIMRAATGRRATLWGASIVGYGRYRYRNTQGEAEWPIVGFSPRKRSISVYIMSGFTPFPDLLRKLGKHSTGKSCLYIKRLADVDEAVLIELIEGAVAYMREHYRCS